MTGALGSSRNILTGKASFRLCLGLALIGTLAACDQDLVLPGERFGTRTALDATVPGASDVVDTDTAQPISLPTATRLSDWPSRGYSSANRLPHAALGGAPVEVFAADIGEGNSRRNRIAADPVAGNGIVYTIDAQARLQATSVNGGGVVWASDLVPDFDRGGNVSGGGMALAGGVLYASTAYGELIAFDAASGAVQWRQRLGSVLGSPTVSNGVIYVVGQNSEAWAVEADDGRLRWQIPAPPAQSVLVGGAAPAISDRSVLLPFPTGEIMAVLPDSGVRVWGTQIAGGRLGAAYADLNDITADPVVVGGTIYVGNQSGRVAAIAAQTGENRWTAREGAYSPILVAGDALFFVSDRNELLRLDAGSGARVWGSELPLFERERPRRRKAVFTHFGPILAGGRLVVASGDGLIRFFSPESGELTGSIELRGGAAANPIVVDDTLLVVSGDGRLHAYR